MIRELIASALLEQSSSRVNGDGSIVVSVSITQEPSPSAFLAPRLPGIKPGRTSRRWLIAMHASILFFLNPGRQSRYYLMGLVRAAANLGIPHATFELGPAWESVQRAGANVDRARTEVAGAIRKAARAIHATHTLGYIANGIPESGLTADADGRPCSMLAADGVQHILLWTDHPNWVAGGQYLEPAASQFLAHPSCLHIVKSQAAADELSEILRWPNVHAMPMAEDYAMLRPATDMQPRFDVVAILGYAHKVPQPLIPFLTQDDPDPVAMDLVMRSAALASWHRATAAMIADSDERVALAEAWLSAKAADPARSFWRHVRSLDPTYVPAIMHLRSDPRAWYAAVHALQDMVRWRRDFWLCWLARRVSVGVFGASAAAYGLHQRREQTAWVEYTEQPAVYAQGRLAININGMPDEEGLTHKPFQMAASGVPMLHHTTAELDRCFARGSEVAVFDRGPVLLEQVRTLLADEARGRDMAEAARTRAMREHTWAERLSRTLELSGADEFRAAA